MRSIAMKTTRCFGGAAIAILLVVWCSASRIWTIRDRPAGLSPDLRGESFSRRRLYSKSSAPSPAPAPAPSPLAPPTYNAPAPSPELSPNFTPQLDDYSDDFSFPHVEIRTKPHKQPAKKNNADDEATRRILTITLALSVALSLILSAIIIYQCCKGRSDNSWNRLRDDRPLLALSSSAFSNSSSSKSLELKDHSMNREKTALNSPSLQKLISDDIKTTTEICSPSSAEVPERETPPKPPPPPLMPPPPVKKAPPPPAAPLPPSGRRSNAPPPAPPRGGASSSRKPPVDEPKTKLKPFFWDKVLTNPDQTMIWHQISSGSFQFNEEMIENLFGYTATKQKGGDDRKAAAFESPKRIQLLEQKKAQNLAILLRALNVTIDEVRDALTEGGELSPEVLQTLIKMAPTPDEELKLRLFTGETSSIGPAERFLKALIDIPFPFQRMHAMLLMSSMEEEISIIKQDLKTIEAACEELKSSRLFKKLLEAVVKIGNRMNDGTYRGGAQAFKLDTLLKLADVKSSDSSTTLLHFLVQQLILSEGRRSSGGAPLSPSTLRRRGLAVLSALPADFSHVGAASLLDAAAISGAVASLRREIRETQSFIEGEGAQLGKFCVKVRGYVEKREAEVEAVGEEEKRVWEMVKSTTDFFYGESGKEEGLRLFVVVRDFMAMLEKAFKEVAEEGKRKPAAKSGAGGGNQEWQRRLNESFASTSEDGDESP